MNNICLSLLTLFSVFFSYNSLSGTEAPDLESKRCCPRSGVTGARGLTGVGVVGATGATGIAAAGTIIPLSSGTPVTLTSLVDGLVGTGSIIGYGDSLTGVTLTGILLDGTTLGNYAFSMPRDGTISSFSAYFSTTVALDIVGTDIVVTAQIYTSATPDNIFTPVAGTALTLTPDITGIVAIGTASNGILTGLNIPVTAQTRVLVFYTITASGIQLANTVVGYASAGISIN